MKKTFALLLAVLLMVCMAVTAYAVSASGDTVVYKTASGTKYHSEGCSSLKGNGIAITLAEAVAAKLEPCSKCNPPTLDSSAASTATAAAATAAAAAAESSGGFLSNVSPVLTFFIGIAVGVVGVAIIRNKMLDAAEAAEAEETAEETGEE